MIPYPDALAIVLDNIRPLPTETVPVAKALGRYLARPVKAPAHSPRFEQSAMDGYAVRMADVKGARPNRPVTLDLVDELPAGDQRAVTFKPGQTVKVFTGSRMPRGAEAVVMKEFVVLKDRRAAPSVIRSRRRCTVRRLSCASAGQSPVRRPVGLRPGDWCRRRWWGWGRSR